MFTTCYEHRFVDYGHNLPWEAPHDFADDGLPKRLPQSADLVSDGG